MLINNIATLRNFIPASVTLDFGDIRPKLKLVEREIIKRIFSTAIYDRLDALDAPTGPDADLKDLLSEAVAHLALLEYLPFGQVQIDSGGVRIATNENMKTAFEWQIDAIKTECSKQGWNAIESALEFCESLPVGELKSLWILTPTYLASKSQLLPSMRRFEQFMNIGHSRVLFNKLAPIIADLQGEVIAPALGKGLFEKILAYSTETEAGKKDVLAQAHKLAAKALAFLAAGIGFQDSILILSDNGPLVIDGIQSRNSKSVKTAPTDAVRLIADAATARGKGALTELLEFCQANSSILTEYQVSPNYITVTDQTNHIPRNDPDWGIAFF